jgi:excisionase family DNA binding protein
MDSLLGIKDVARLTGLAVGTLYHMVSEGRIPVVRISRRCLRFRQSDLLHWFDELTDAPRDRLENDLGKVSRKRREGKVSNLLASDGTIRRNRRSR